VRPFFHKNHPWLKVSVNGASQLLMGWLISHVPRMAKG